MRGYKREYPPLTAEQQELINDYLDMDKTMMIPNYAPVKRAIRSVIRRHISPQEMEDYIGIAHLALMKAAACFNPNQKMSFASFATLNICSAIKTELTRQNRQCRRGEKTTRSLEASISECGELCLMELLIGAADISFQEYDRIKCYLDTQSNEAKHVLRLRLMGYEWDEIRELLGYTGAEMHQIMLKMQKYENTQILRRENYSNGKGKNL